MASQPRVARACISCRTRKVKCTGKAPCPECNHNGLICTFQPRAKSAASRANTKRCAVTIELRSSQTQGHSTASHRLAPQGITRMRELGSSFDDGFFHGLCSDYAACVYTTCPLLPVPAVEATIRRRGNHAGDASLCYAYAAATLAMTSSGDRGRSSQTHSTDAMAELISRALQTRPIVVHRSEIDIWQVVTSIFLRITFRRLQNYDMTLLYHREAVSMLQVVGLGIPGKEEEDDIYYSSMATGDREIWLRTHWVLFIYERLTAIDHGQRPVLATPTRLPEAAEVDDEIGRTGSHGMRRDGGHVPAAGEPGHQHQIPRAKRPKIMRKRQEQQQEEKCIQVGFARACELYWSIDDEFLGILTMRDQSPLLTQEWIINKQEALGEQHKLIDAVCPHLCPVQRIDLISTCQWLRLRVWQMASWKCLLSSSSLQDYMILYFPIQNSAAYILQFFQQDPDRGALLGRCSMGVLQKIFEVVDIASDLLNVTANFTLSRKDIDVVGKGREITQQLITQLQDSGKLDENQFSRLCQRQHELQMLDL